MKILYAIQGTGNGHIARARAILPAINLRAEVDVLVSGMHSELLLDHPIKFQFKGLGFKFGKRGGVDYFNTWWHGDMPRFLREVKALDLSEYDLVISDFEPVSAWAARRQHVPCVGLSNQCVLSHPEVVGNSKPGFGKIGKMILKHYAPVDVAYGFHYQPAGPFVSTPIIRQEIRDLKVTDAGHYLVYLPSYHDDNIIKAFFGFANKRWIVFSKSCKSRYKIGHIEIYPVEESSFREKLGSATGVICAAGFSTTSEALYLGKKLMVIPMKKQYEQKCNAKALEKLGVPVIKSLKSKWHRDIEHWLRIKSTIQVIYPDNAQEMVDRILIDYANQNVLINKALELTDPV